MRVPTIPTPPLPTGHTRAAVVLADLRAADTSWAAVRPSSPPSASGVAHGSVDMWHGGMRPEAPSRPQATPVCDASRALALSGRFIRTQRGHYDSIAAELEAALAELAELAPIAALLAEDEPDTGWGTHAEQLAEVSV